MEPKTIDIAQAQVHLSELITSASPGTEFILTQDSSPIARLVTIPTSNGKRIPGLNRGEVWMSDDFDDSLPEDFLLGEQ